MSSAPPSARVERLARRGRLGCLVLLALLVAGEVAVRLVEGDATSGSLYDYLVLDGDFFKMRPGASLVVPERYGDVTYSFNRAGYRDRDHGPPGKAPRIVLLGDSVSFGLGAAQDAIYPARLEEELAKRLRPPTPEVVNLAIFAFHTGNELEALRRDGGEHRPALVVLQFYMNDLGMADPAAGEAAPAEPPAAPPPALLARLRAGWNRLAYSSALYRRFHQAGSWLTYQLVHDLRRRHPETLNDAEPRHKLAYLAARPADADVPAFQALTAIRHEAEAAGARVLLVVSPDEVQLFDASYDVIGERLAAFAADQGMPFLDLLPVLRAREDRADLFLDGVHYSPLGHRVVAEILAEEISSRWFSLPADPSR